ncbi:hypothetical protein [Paraliomyxa miuraensis]|uniref:hypothetical protein n=1 Tax=Paraliomyxa miuraensis TaxID=376150 RepID=UPI002250CAE1|nr:hypothetical protein [Paraliomyxa miuraensis]MCX4241724.1 hypothetical protein [Paraliomyxa miuraensis]
MSSVVATAILELAESTAPGGVTMGRIVDTLEGQGFAPEVVEQELWRLLALRKLTPCGYVCRKVRRRDGVGELEQARSYELLFIPWSEDLDRQLELRLAEGDR